MKAYKFRIYPGKKQTTALNSHLEIARSLWNNLLKHTKDKYEKEGKFPSKIELQKVVRNSGLYSQTAQNISHRLHNALQYSIIIKKKGMKCGFPRFKKEGRMKSLHYPQFGFLLGHSLEVTPFGKIAIKKHREIKGKIKTLTLKKERSGKWFAIFIAEEGRTETKMKIGKAVGLDLGLMNFATFSDATKIENPNHLKKWEERLAFIQRRCSRKNKGSHNRDKALLIVARLYEKIANSRKDFLHKIANLIISKYSIIAMEGLSSQEMTKQGYGKGINDAAWRMFANVLTYKAADAGCKLVFVNPKNTSRDCSRCGQHVEKCLWERKHVCFNCGLSIDRDLNAAINILKRATAGQAGSNACGDRAATQKGQARSLKQELYTIDKIVGSPAL